MSLDGEATTNGATSTVREHAPSVHGNTSMPVHTPPPHEVMRLPAKPVLDDVLREEAAFANREYAPFANQLDVAGTMFRKYTRPAELWDWRQMAALLLGNIAGKQTLDYGCGMGEESIYLAKLGARVTSIDISEVGIATLQERARHHKLDICALEMRCDPTTFPAESFDRIHGMGILHHVGIETALAEVRRLLRPGGIGVFLEPMGDAPIIEAAKNFAMAHARFLGDFEEVTDHEHNLTWQEIEVATRPFSRALSYPYHVLYRLRRFLPMVTRKTVRQLDHAMLSFIPKLRHYAGAVVIQVVK